MSNLDFTTDMTSRMLPEKIGKYLVHRTRVTIVPEGQSIYSDDAVEIAINDTDDGRECVQVTNNSWDDNFLITAESWPAIRQVIDVMVARCRVEREQG
jgi:hypothetical protein